MGDWINCNDALPKYGQQVSIKVNGVEIKGRYVRDGADFTMDWFEEEVNTNHEHSIFIDYIEDIEWKI